MSTIVRASILRFFRLKAWILALVLPAGAAVFAALRAAPGQEDPAGAFTLLAFLQYAFPALAAIFVITFWREEPPEVLLVRPVGWTGVVLGRWVGVVAVFGACHLALAGGTAGLLALREAGPDARKDRSPSGRQVAAASGEPGEGSNLCRPWPAAGDLDPAWLDRVQSVRRWILSFDGLLPGAPCEARLRAFSARVISQGAGGTGGRELARSKWAPARLAFGRGQPPAGGLSIEIPDGEPLVVPVPAGAVDAAGRLDLVLDRAEEPTGESAEGSWGPTFFWFEGGGSDPAISRDVRVSAGRIPFSENVLRATIQAAGELLLVSALAAAAAALFSSGVAFGLTMAIYILAGSRPFLADTLDMLSRESALALLSDPAHPAASIEPTPFDRALEVFLRSWIRLLPDLGIFRAGLWLERGEAVASGAIARSWGIGAAYAAVFLAIAAVLGRGKEVRR
jgi:hypothetical protein